jgi:CelD/BcsL family acetyltransferase involved in cellulose biosynthesis
MVAMAAIRTDVQFSTSVIRTNADLVSLGPDWEDLFQRTLCDNVFLSFEWLSEWWFNLGQDHQLFVITARDDGGRLVALAPLYISLQGGPLRIRRLGFLGDKFVGSDHLDFLVDDACTPAAVDCIGSFLSGCRGEWDFIELLDSRAESVALARFREKMKTDGMTARTVHSSLCPYLRLPESTEEYLASLRPKLRKNLKYYARSLQREGCVEFVTVEHAAEIEGAFDDLLRLHETGFAQRGRHSKFLNPRVTEFHRAAVKRLSETRRARIYFLELRGKRIAALYGFSTGRKFFYYQSGADPAYRRFSIGITLISSVIQAAVRTGHAEFDFLRGNEPYKQLWASDTHQLYSASLFDQRGRSRIGQSGQLIQQTAQHCKASIRYLMARFSEACKTAARTSRNSLTSGLL